MRKTFRLLKKGFNKGKPIINFIALPANSYAYIMNKEKNKEKRV